MQIDIEYLERTLAWMVGVNSVLPNELEFASRLSEELRRLGLEPEWHEAAPGRPNVYATADLGPSPRFLVFSGHSDTVDVASGWETDPFQLTLRDGRFFGLGVINMKAGLACMLVAIKALLDSGECRGQLGRLGLAVTVDQEGQSLGAHALLATEYADCDAMLHGEHFFGDAPETYLPRACTGKILYRLTVQGRAAHACRPQEGGVNAVTDAARIVVALDRLRFGEHPLFGRGTACVLKIDGGYKQYSMVVPERCEVVITRLIVPGETRDTAVHDLQFLIDSLRLKSRVTIETPPPAYQPYLLDESAPILPVFRDAYRRAIGCDPHFAGHRGIVDANIFCGEAQIPTIVFGPKGGLHHRPGEYVERWSLEPTARVYAETARCFLAEHGTRGDERGVAAAPLGPDLRPSRKLAASVNKPSAAVPKRKKRSG